MCMIIIHPKSDVGTGKGCKLSVTHLILRLRFLCSSSALDNLAATEIAVRIVQLTCIFVTHFSSAVLSCLLDSTALSFNSSSSSARCKATPTAPPTWRIFPPSSILYVPPNEVGREWAWPPLDLDCSGSRSLRLVSRGVVGRSSLSSLGAASGFPV